MEFQRRVGNASLAEVAGEAALKIDKLMATYGVYGSAEQAFHALRSDTQAVVTAYIDGINAYLDSDPRLPFEFVVLGYKPRPWTPADVLVWTKIMSLDLSSNLNQEISRYRLHARLGISRERVEELIPACVAFTVSGPVGCACVLFKCLT